jgi:hypothetical protein
MRAVIAPHAIYGYGNQRELDRSIPNEARRPCVLLAPMSPRERALGGVSIMPLSRATGQPKAGECYSPLVLTTFLPR